LDTNALVGTIPNSLFDGWYVATSISLRRNSLIGTVPSVLLALPMLQVLYLCLNMLSGTLLPSTISQPLMILDVQNNSGLVGSLPVRNIFVSLCVELAYAPLLSCRHSTALQIPRKCPLLPALQLVRSTCNKCKLTCGLHFLCTVFTACW
ncbi:GP46-like surface antigen, putative, partial [Bodo saltans]